MRFSFALPARSTPLPLVGQHPVARELPVQAPPVAVQPVPAVSAEPPDDLDQRVRMVGEWQVGDL